MSFRNRCHLWLWEPNLIYGITMYILTKLVRKSVSNNVQGIFYPLIAILRLGYRIWLHQGVFFSWAPGTNLENGNDSCHAQCSLHTFRHVGLLQQFYIQVCYRYTIDSIIWYMLMKRYFGLIIFVGNGYVKWCVCINLLDCACKYWWFCFN